MIHRVIVVGGGISGLAAAHRLTELSRERNFPFEIVLLEASRRLGGSIATERVGEFLVEAGPDSFITEKPWALRLCERLGIASRLISTSAGYQKIYVVHKGRLQPLPEGFFLLAPTRLWPFARSPLFSWSGKLRAACDLFLRGASGEGDESLASFVRRRFGREVLERVAQPLIGGIYAADPERLSLAATMPRFLEMERASRSIIRAMRIERRRSSHEKQSGSGARWSLFVTPAGGMQELVDALAGRLPVGSVQVGKRVTGLAREETKRKWILTTNVSENFEADGLILATPAYTSAEILSPAAPHLAQELRMIPYASTATVSLAYRREDVFHPLDAFGFVVPAIENRRIIACTFSSVKYSGRAPDGYVLLRAFVGGALQPSLLETDDAGLEADVRRELAELLGIRAAPLFCRIFRHPLSMPQYKVGHLELVRRIDESLQQLPGLQLAGNAYRGVGISDCIRSGEEAAEKLGCG
jgi:oxygen-dependent protoporphyrinogen oxidase